MQGIFKTLSKNVMDPQVRPLWPLALFVSMGVTGMLGYGTTVLLTDPNLRTFRGRYHDSIHKPFEAPDTAIKGPDHVLFTNATPVQQDGQMTDMEETRFRHAYFQV